MKAKHGFLVGVGGIGSGMFLGLRGNETLGRNESRAATILPRRDFCKLHIVSHYVAVLTGAAEGGFAVLPIGKVGDDDAGRAMRRHMREAGMDTRFVTAEPRRPTLYSVCFTYPDGDGGNITTDDSASSVLTADDVDRALERLPEVLGARDQAGGVALAVPEVPLAPRLRLLEQARRRRWLTAAAVNTAEVPQAMQAGMFAHVDLLSVNREEAAGIAGMNPDADPRDITRAAGERLAEAHPALRLCVTAGQDGAFGWERGALEHTPPAPVRALNTAGAGDATLSGLILAEIAGLPFVRPDRPRRQRLADAPLETALDLAALLAGLAVGSPDTINFHADADAVAALARRIGADFAGLRPALETP